MLRSSSPSSAPSACAVWDGEAVDLVSIGKQRRWTAAETRREIVGVEMSRLARSCKD